MCGCNKGKNDRPATSYVVTRNGQSQEFENKADADIAATKNGGTITVKRK